MLPLVALAVSAIAVVVTAALAIGYRWEQPYIASEYVNLFHADRLGALDGLYTDPGPGSWSFPVYFPGLYALLAPLTWITGAEQIWLERLAALAALLGVCGLSALTALRLGAGRVAATLSGLALLGFAPVGYIAGVVRPDVFALLFAAAALAVVTRWEDERRRNLLTAAALLCAAMVLTRQVYAPIGLALLIAVAIRDRRAAVYLAAVAGAATVAVLALAELASGGAFSDDMGAFTDLFRLSSLTELLESQLWPPNPLYLLGALACLAGFLGVAKVRAAHLAWLGGAICCLAAVKVGSSGNYLLPLMWASAVLSGPVFELARARLSPPAFAAAAVALALALIPSSIDAIERADELAGTLSGLERSQEEAAKRLEAVEGEVLADRFDLMLAAGRTPDFEALLLAQLEVTGERTPTELAEALRARRFATVQASFDLHAATPEYQGLPYWPPSVVAAARSGYCEVWQGGFVWLYEPCGA
jgi:hypothetical protein